MGPSLWTLFQSGMSLWFGYDTEDNKNQLAFWTTNEVIDIATQLYVGLAPIYLLFNLHLPMAKRLPAMVSFTPNLTYRNPPNLRAHVLT